MWDVNGSGEDREKGSFSPMLTVRPSLILIYLALSCSLVHGNDSIKYQISPTSFSAVEKHLLRSGGAFIQNSFARVMLENPEGDVLRLELRFRVTDSDLEGDAFEPIIIETDQPRAYFGITLKRSVFEDFTRSELIFYVYDEANYSERCLMVGDIGPVRESINTRFVGPISVSEGEQYHFIDVVVEEIETDVERRRVILDAPLGNADYVIVTPFSRRESVSGKVLHLGVDLAVSSFTKVTAAADGIIRESRFDSTDLGLYLVIEHTSDVFSYYGHLSDVDVLVGEAVRGGQVIARSGNTGFSYTPCLHFALKRADTYYNPVTWSVSDL